MAFSILAGFCSPRFSSSSCRKVSIIDNAFRYSSLFSGRSNYSWISRNLVGKEGSLIRNQKSPTGYFSNLSGGAMMSTTSGISSDDQSSFKWPPRSSPWLSKTSPWLLLPPTFDAPGGKMVYQFYSLGENKVLGLKKRRQDIEDDEVEYEDEDEDEDKDGDEDEDEDGAGEDDWAPDDGCKVVGSSHGWLALYNEDNADLFLSNPLYRRHVKLPPIHTLGKNKCVTNVIISSSSPDDDEDCRAMITYGPDKRLAFCCPGHKYTKWTPLGDRAAYESCVYSAAQKLFFCCTTTRFRHPDYFEGWDLRDPLSPRMIPMAVTVDKDNYPLASRSKQEYDRKFGNDDYKFLVIAGPLDQLFHVRRFLIHWMGPNGCYIQDQYYGPKMGFDDTTPYKTIGFDVHKYDPETGSMIYMDRTLDGLALFVGSNHGFALSAAEYPELKPNSIYYTAPPKWGKCCGGHDVGIFNYEDETFSPCFYPCDVQSRKRTNPPMWFTPTPLVRFPFLVKNSDGTLSYASSCSNVPPTKLKDANVING